MNEPFARYDRQIRFERLGTVGQQRLAEACALIAGCGALGSASAQWLVRAGVGRVRIIDRDAVDLGNLHRQTLFDEDDAAAALPKAIAARERLRKINSQVAIEAIVADLNDENIAQWADGADVIVDGTDNFETRMLLNDWAVAQGVPWIYGGVIADEGRAMTVLPRQTPCLRCLLPQPPVPGTLPTCETAGVMGPAAGLVAAWQANEAIKLLSGNVQHAVRGLALFDLWSGRLRIVDIGPFKPESDCPSCGRGEYPALAGRERAQTFVLCGRNAVQINLSGGEIDLEHAAQRLQSVAERTTANRYLVRAFIDGWELTLFADGRAIIGGTADPVEARSRLAKYLGL